MASDSLEYWDEGEDFWDEGEHWLDDPCSRCGPWCEHWGGDGLCMIVIEQRADEWEEYHSRYVTNGIYCPICGAQLTEYKIPADELWVWPGGFYNPMIALDIYAVYDAPKGELHRHDGVCHIWVGEGKQRRECLVKLLGEVNDPETS